MRNNWRWRGWDDSTPGSATGLEGRVVGMERVVIVGMALLLAGAKTEVDTSSSSSSSDATAYFLFEGTGDSSRPSSGRVRTFTDGGVRLLEAPPLKKSDASTVGQIDADTSDWSAGSSIAVGVVGDGIAQRASVAFGMAGDGMEERVVSQNGTTEVTSKAPVPSASSLGLLMSSISSSLKLFNPLGPSKLAGSCGI